MPRVVVLVLVALLLQPVCPAAQAPAAELYPIVFVHGFCSTADTWSDMTTALSAFNPARDGTTVTRLSAGVAFPGQDASRRMFAIDFRGLAGSVEPRDVAQVPIAAKAVELKQVINEVKRITYRNPQGIVTPFDLPVGATTAVVVPSNLPGAFTVWVHAQNAAGESPASNEIAFTMPAVQ